MLNCAADCSAGGGALSEEERRQSAVRDSSEPDLAALALTEQAEEEVVPPEMGEGLSAEAARKAAIVENLFHAERRRRKSLEAEARSTHVLVAWHHQNI